MSVALIICSALLPAVAAAASSDGTIPIPYAKMSQSSDYAPFGAFTNLFSDESAKHPDLPWNLYFARDIVADKSGHASAKTMFGRIYMSSDDSVNGFLASSAELPLGSEQTASATLVLNRTGAIAGKVRDDSGNPLAGIVVDVQGIPIRDKYGNVERCEIYASDISGHDGTYVITSGIDPSCEYRLEAGAPSYPYYSSWYLDPVRQQLVSDAGYITPLRFKEPSRYDSLTESSLFNSTTIARLQVKPDEVTVTDLVLKAVSSTNLGSISGKVVDISGRPIAGATVTARTDAGSWQDITNLYGNFLIKHVPPGNYTVEAQPDDSRLVVRHATGVLIEPGRNADIGNLVGEQSASISGRLSLSDGTPLAGMFVEIRSTRLDSGYEHFYPCECIASSVSDELDQRGTDEQGRYKLAKNLPPGTYSISVNNYDLNLGDRTIRLEPAAKTITMRSGENITDANLVFNYTILQDFAKLKDTSIRFYGHVRDNDGNPLGGVTVASRAFVKGHSSVEFATQTNDDGFYNLYILQKDVPESTDGLEWTIYVSKNPYSSYLFYYEDAVREPDFAIYSGIGGQGEPGVTGYWGDQKQLDYTLQKFTLDDLLTSNIEVDVRGEPARYSLPTKQFMLSTGYDDDANLGFSGEDIYLTTNSTLTGSWLDTQDNSIVVTVNPIAGTSGIMDIVIPNKMASKVSRVLFDGQENAGTSNVPVNATHTKVSLVYKDTRRIEIQAAQVVPELGHVMMVAAIGVGGLVAARLLGFTKKN